MPTWTREQQHAIDDRGGTLLVSAAAGSGKTAVLTERVVTRLLDAEHPTDADRLLVVTFTNAAAAEMRERVAHRLSARADDPALAPLIQRQLVLLDRADFCTIDAFCIRLVRSHFEKLGISPDFRLVDEGELAVLQDEALTDVMDACYRAGDAAFVALSEQFNNFRDDMALRDAVLKLYRFVRSHPFYRDWLHDRVRLYETAMQDVPHSPWAEILYPVADEALQQVCDAAVAVLGECVGDAALEKVYTPDTTDTLELAKAAQQACRAREFDRLYHLVHTYGHARLVAPRNFPEPERVERIKACREQIKTIFEELCEQFCSTADEFRADLEELFPHVRGLFDLTERFADRLDAYKQEKNVADFADTEQWALELILQKTPDGYVRTPLADELAEKYEEILIDECQDSNDLQDLLFRSLSRNEDNLFLVGDVKQSIYQFRQASPALFVDKMRRYAPYDGKTYPATLTLNRNFRSRKTVTEAVNFFFDQLMTVDFGGVAYTAERLIAGASYDGDDAPYAPELVLVGTAEEQSALQAQAAYVAKRVRAMLDTLPVTDRDGRRRKARFGDFCILLRSVKNRACVFAEALEQYGIPAQEQGSDAFFSLPEITSTLALLRVLDNPSNDLAMLTVLYADYADFSSDDIVRLRLVDRDLALYETLVRYAAEGEDTALREKASRWLERFFDLRRFAAEHSVSALLLHLDATLQLSELFALRYNDPQTVQNLSRLVAFAAQFEGVELNSLTAFLRRIDRMIEQEKDLKTNAASGQNAVQIITIHHSKGLEFPVCFVADLDHRFNKTDLHKNLQLHGKLGFACSRRDEAEHTEFTTVPLAATRVANRDAFMAEELRMLYVAMTRAREKLILVIGDQNPTELITRRAARLVSDSATLSPYLLRHAASFADWLLYAALRHPGQTLCDTPYTVAQGCNLHITLAGADINSDPAAQNDPLPAVPPAQRDRLQADRAFAYPYEEATRVPTKAAVSQIAEKEAPVTLKTPAFDNALTPAEIGTALHTFMQFADYQNAREDVAAERDRLLRKGFLTARQAEAMPLLPLEAFFVSDFAKTMLSADEMRREVRFMTAVPACELYPDITTAEPVMVQGVADCIVRHGERVTIVDYKSDRVSRSEQLAERYRDQLLLYRRAVSEASGIPESQIACKIWSFHLATAIEV